MDRTPEFFVLTIDVEVKDVKHLKTIIAALRALSEIRSVARGSR